MGRLLRTFALFALVILSLGVAARAQTWTKEAEAQLFADVANDEKLVAECEKANREAQIKQFGKPLPKLAGHCWDGCPVRIPKPYYSPEARRLKVTGDVFVDTIVDEKGNVIWAKVAKGNPVVNREALVAAYNARYQPKITCGEKPIKFRWTIKYHFSPPK